MTASFFAVEDIEARIMESQAVGSGSLWTTFVRSAASLQSSGLLHAINCVKSLGGKRVSPVILDGLDMITPDAQAQLFRALEDLGAKVLT